MKNVGVKFKVFVSLSLILICAFFTSVFAEIGHNYQIYAESFPEQNLTESFDSFDDFTASVLNLNQQYQADENALVFLNKNNDLTVDNDGHYYITEQNFTQSTGVVLARPQVNQRGIMQANDNSSYELNELAEQAGYNVTNSEQSVVLTRPFGLKRLMIDSDTSDLDLYGAVAAVTYRNLHVHQYATAAATQEAYQKYLMRADVQHVLVDRFCWVDDVQSSETQMVAMNIETLTYKTWGAEKMGVQKYAQYLLDTVNAGNNEITALPEITVAVLDTGIDTDHPWFEDRFLIDENNKIIGKDFSDATSVTEYTFEDDHGHGTHCAGIVRDLTLSNVKILPLKFMKCDNDGKATGSTLNAAMAVQYAIAKKDVYNIVAINMSFGHESEDVYDVFPNISTAYDNGIFCVVSAGNDHQNANNYTPANEDKAITVSALTIDNQTQELIFDSSYSNYGSCVDVCAPGTGILSSWFGGYFTRKQGTSMAAPHVAAYIALLKSDPNHNYTQTEIGQILAGNRSGYITDLGAEGKDDYYGYGMPTLTAATPNYCTVEISSDGHGTVSPTGLNLYTPGTDVTISFTPNEHYHIAAIYVDNEPLSDVANLTEYVFTNLNASHEFLIQFEIDDASFTVNYYLETIYDVDSTAPHEYELDNSETVTGKIGTTTSVVAKNYLGFTANNIQQETIAADGSTVVNVYYQRNFYHVTTRKSGVGIATTTGDGNYLFGATVNLMSTTNIGYDWYIWHIEECSDENFSQTFKARTIQQEFLMPASDLIVTAYAQPSIYLITVKISGHGKVISDSVTVHYGESMDFQIKPDAGYKMGTVYRDNVALELNEVLPDTLYTVSLDNIKANTELSVGFVKINVVNNQHFDTTTWFGIGAAAIILFGSSAAILTITFIGKKKINYQTKQQTKRVKKSPENHLLNAFDFVNGREEEFTKFCKANKIKYKTDYHEAVIQFYDYHHKDNNNSVNSGSRVKNKLAKK